ncbi:MAG: Flp pilus assembly protein CpaB [Nitrospinota bacterium]
MRRWRRFARGAWAGLFVVAFVAGAVRGAPAQEGKARLERPPTSPYQVRRDGTSLRLTAGKSVMVSVPYSVQRISVAEPKVADVITISPSQFLVSGKNPGVTNVIVWDKSDRTFIFNLLVQVDAEALEEGINKLYPQESLTVRAVKDAIVISGMTAGTDVRDGVGRIAEIFAQKKVVNLITAPELADTISTGMRAVTIRVNDVIGVAGFLVLGTRVDVLTTMELKKPARTVTRVILQRVMVIAIGPRREPSKEKGKEGFLVTLLVTPSQAERLTLASTKGLIHLALRSGPDEGAPTTTGVTPRLLMFGSPRVGPSAAARRRRRPRVARPAPARRRTPPKRDIEIYRGVKRSIEPVTE